MRWLAELLHWLATRIHKGDHKEFIEIRDEFDIIRCRIEVMGDDHHGVDATFVRLPQGWDCLVLGNTHDYKFCRSDER